MKPVKPPITYKEQLEKFRSRGCIIENEEEAIDILTKVNYYRLTAYFLPFKMPNGSYKQGTNFKSIYRIYEFDRKIRHIIFSAIEEIEVFIRAVFAYYHAHRFGALGYLDPNNYNQGHKHNDLITQIDNEKKKQSKELFIKHHNSNYGGQFPIWVIIELFSFGTLSRFFADLPGFSQKYLARTFFKCHQKDLASWLYCSTILRNICAHFKRLYYRKFSVIPNGVPALDQSNNRSLFAVIMALRSLYNDTVQWNDEVFSPIKKLIVEYSADIQLDHIGFPLDWESKLKR